ncbi:MAG: hypothetical protein IJX78_03895 [Bacilli bacterium]|nr:hypothetical protein [Bacilli bacterium]
MKKVLGYILSVMGIIGFVSLYFLMVLFKESPAIGYIVMGIGYIVVTVFIIGVRLIVKRKKQA